EANAEEYWQAPTLHLGPDRPASTGADEDNLFDDSSDDDDDFDDDADFENEYEYNENGSELDDEVSDDEYEEEDGGQFDAAYDEFIYRDTTHDGAESDLADDGAEPLNTEWCFEVSRLEQRLIFLNTVARLWKHAAITW